MSVHRILPRCAILDRAHRQTPNVPRDMCYLDPEQERFDAC